MASFPAASPSPTTQSAAQPCPFNSGAAPRDMSRFAQSLQQVEACLSSLQRLNEQITALAAQRRGIQDELRSIQTHINDEFDRILKPSRPAAAKVVSRTVPPDAAPALRMGGDLTDGESETAGALARAAS